MLGRAEPILGSMDGEAMTGVVSDECARSGKRESRDSCNWSRTWLLIIIRRPAGAESQDAVCEQRQRIIEQDKLSISLGSFMVSQGPSQSRYGYC